MMCWQSRSVFLCLAVASAWAQQRPAVVSPLGTSDYFGVSKPSLPAALAEDEHSRALIEDRLAEMRTGWVALDVDLSALEAEPGVFDFTATDALFQRYRSRGQRLLVRLVNPPGFNRDASCTADCGPADVTQFAASLRAVVRRYRGEVHAWELLPAPNRTNWPAGSGGDVPVAAVRYAELMTVAYKTVKEEDYWVRVLSGAPACRESQAACDAWRSAFLKALNGARGFDVIAIAAPANAASLGDAVREAQRAFAAAGYCQLPVWITSMSWPAADEAQEATASEAVQKAVESVQGIPEVQKIFWDRLVDDAGETSGLLRADLSMKQVFYVYGYYSGAAGFAPAPFKWSESACVVPAPDRTFHVAISATCASDSNNGLGGDCSGPNRPWKTLRRGVRGLKAGDTLLVHEGAYREVDVTVATSGAPGAPITIRAEGDVRVAGQGGGGSIFLLHGGNYSLPPVSWIVIEGFTLVGEGIWKSAGAGIDMTYTRNVTLRNNTIRGLGAGVVAPASRWALVENNIIEGNYNSHGVYFSCAHDVACSEIVVRGNLFRANLRAGLQFNAFDLTPGGKRLVQKNALVEENFFDQNASDGPSQLSVYSLQDALLRNNVMLSAAVPDSMSKAVSVWRQDPRGGQDSKNIAIVGNCMDVSTGPDGVGIYMLRGSQGLNFRGNTVVLGASSGPAVSVMEQPQSDLRSDFNRYSANEGIPLFEFLLADLQPKPVPLLADWQAATGLDANSVVGKFSCPAAPPK
ncbi:MAG: right-handed parallel beta-helix repeat-containing protein [Acidobacteria bacterium]|nr:right-handed parallel beta-helix repeat-containing protein [Acidobacteriota bacterium]